MVDLQYIFSCKFLSTETNLKPKSGRRICPNRRRSSRSRFTAFIGIAKLMFCAPETIAALIPTTSPSKFTSGPPEFQSLLLHRFELVPRISCGLLFGSAWATITRERPETIPNETVFLKIPSALPIVITLSPSSSFPALPSLTTGRPVALILK